MSDARKVGQPRAGIGGIGGMAGAAAFVVAALVLGLCTLAIAYALGVRAKSGAVRDAARHFHRAVGNPVQMRTAGSAGRFASVLRHRGRTTGRTYETPVWAAPTEDGFVIAIVYGAGTDWLKNVLASGTAAIVHDGRSCLVVRPEIVPMESARSYFPVMLQRTHRRLRVDRCLRVRRVEAANALSTVSVRAGGGHDEPAG
jgi:deazaflavin-dependent oxidoreductase (nitroreductase family)